MARPKVGSDVMPVRFPDGTFAAIDAVSGNRSEFIRRAVARSLCGGGLPDKGKGVGLERLKVSDAPKAVSAGRRMDGDIRSGDKAALLALVRENMLNSRAAAKRLGWPGLRYRNAEKALMDEGRLMVVDGFLEAVE